MNQLTQPTPEQNPDQFGLLDILLTIAEQLRLIVVGSLLCGAVGYGLASIWPKKFESVAIVRADPEFATQVKAAFIIDGALNKLGYFKDADEEEAEELRESLRRSIYTQANREDRIVTVRLSADSAEKARALQIEILRTVFEVSKPRGAELKDLEAEKVLLEGQVQELTVTAQIARRLLVESGKTENAGDLASSLAAISINLSAVQGNITRINRKIAGLSEEDLLQPPTVAKKPVSPKPGPISIMTAICACALLILFVLARHGLRHSGTTGARRQRIDNLLRQYRFVQKKNDT